MPESDIEKDVEEKTEKPKDEKKGGLFSKKKTISDDKPKEVKKATGESKHLKFGVCQICGANIKKGQPHHKKCPDYTE